MWWPWFRRFSNTREQFEVGVCWRNARFQLEMFPYIDEEISPGPRPRREETITGGVCVSFHQAVEAGWFVLLSYFIGEPCFRQDERSHESLTDFEAERSELSLTYTAQ
jgi:hypothetical protein